MSQDISEFTRELTLHLRTIADNFLDAAEGDATRFAEEMAQDLSAAAFIGDVAVVEEIQGQAMALAEKHKINLEESMWDFFMEQAAGAISLVITALRLSRGFV